MTTDVITPSPSHPAHVPSVTEAPCRPARVPSASADPGGEVRRLLLGLTFNLMKYCAQPPSPSSSDPSDSSLNAVLLTEHSRSTPAILDQNQSSRREPVILLGWLGLRGHPSALGSLGPWGSDVFSIKPAPHVVRGTSKDPCAYMVFFPLENPEADEYPMRACALHPLTSL